MPSASVPLRIAFADNAFAAVGFSVNKLDDMRPLKCQLFHWKDEMLDIPMFRHHVQVERGRELHRILLGNTSIYPPALNAGGGSEEARTSDFFIFIFIFYSLCPV